MLKNLKKLREETGITQKQLAELIGVSQQAINKYENHNIEPDIQTMIRIADVFSTSVDYLVDHTTIRRRIEETQKYELNSDEGTLIDLYRKLSPKQKHCVTTVVNSYTN